MIFCRNSIYLCSHHHLALCYYARCTAKKQGVIENFLYFFYCSSVNLGVSGISSGGHLMNFME